MADYIPFSGENFHLDFDQNYPECTDYFGDDLCPPHQKVGKDLNISECRTELRESLVDTGERTSRKPALIDWPAFAQGSHLSFPYEGQSHVGTPLHPLRWHLLSLYLIEAGGSPIVSKNFMICKTARYGGKDMCPIRWWDSKCLKTSVSKNQALICSV